jgi:hypothetical protein
MICSQDQWDIHVLDPAYTCLFRAPPNLPIIVRNEAFNNEYTHSTTFDTSKRHLSTPPPDRNTASPLKKSREAEPGDARLEETVEDQEMADLSPDDAPLTTKRKGMRTFI